MVPVRADFGSEYSKSAASPEAVPSARPRLVLCDVSHSPAPPCPAAARSRRSRNGWQRSLLSFAVVCSFLFLLCTCVSTLWHDAVVAYANSLHTSAPVVSVHVGKGDTLWRYAARYGDPESYMPERVQAIAHENHLRPSAPLAPGQTLRITVRNPVELARLNQQPHSRMASTVVR